jgi:hypothetical protein
MRRSLTAPFGYVVRPDAPWQRIRSMRSRLVLAPLRERNFRNQYLASAISAVGTTMGPVAMSLGVLQATGSLSTLGLVLAAGSIPMVLFTLLGGVWADRLPRDRVMIAADLVRVGSQSAAGSLLLTGRVELWSFMVIAGISGTATAIFQPASIGLTAVTVRPVHLQQANALLSLTRSAAGLAGPLVAGILAATVGAGWALIADAATFLGSAYFLSLLRLTETPRAATTSIRHDLAVGFRAVANTSWIWTSILGFMAIHLAFGILLVLGPAMLLEYENGAIGWGAIIAALFAGGLLGDAMALRLRPARLILAARLVEFLGLPLLIAFALQASPPVLAAAAFLAGTAATFPDALWFTALQQHVPEDILSRVSSYDWMGSFALRPIGNTIGPGAAALVGAGPTLMACAVLIGLIHAGSLFFPSVRKLRRVDEPLADRAAV